MYLIIVNRSTAFDDTIDYNYNEIKKSGLTEEEATKFILFLRKPFPLGRGIQKSQYFS